MREAATEGRPWGLLLGFPVLAGTLVVLGGDWRAWAGFGAALLAGFMLFRPFFGLCLTAAVLFVGTPSLKITYASGVVAQFYPSMVLLPLALAGFFFRAALDGRPVGRRPGSVLTPFVAAIVVLDVLGLIWAPHFRFAVDHVLTVAFDAALFAALCLGVTDARRLEALLWTVVASAVAVCATMVCGALYDWVGTLRLASGVELNFELFSDARWGRIGGLCSANQSGGYLVFAIFAAAGLAWRHRGAVRWGLCLLAATFLTFVVVSASRGAMLGFLGAAGLFLVLHPGLRARLVSRSALLAAILLAAVLVGKPSFIDRMLVGFGYDGPLLFSEKKTSTGSANVSGSGARLRMWRDALYAMADDPELFVLGLGPGGLIWTTREPEVHSLWLAFYFDLGLAGGLIGLLGLATLAAAVAAAVKRAPPGPARTLFLGVLGGALAELGIHSLIDHDLTSPVARFAWFYMAVLAAALAIVRQTLPDRPAAVRPDRPRRVSWRLPS